ncbi:hypothetical protein MATL_G00002170 [Megalops atlanticus]|uniref:Fibrinogen C-terminal domain-containing protein n=1 Tax=Megalops atlanticus TaxID=7932 RepID=A0A9D3TDR4_MEGAT|nr:hypothetical protein MATL_G00002170 [Megalops atlanticus]
MMVPVLLFLLLPVAILSLPVRYEPMDCENVYINGSTHSGVYTIFPAGQPAPVQVFCDMDCDEDSDVGGWTVIQRRMDASVNFYRPWEQYKNGFGNVSGEYWLGLENIFHLTRSRKYKLRVDMEDFEGGKVHAQYSSFSIDPESEGYTLHVSGYADGGAGDSLAQHNGQKFSTFNKDQDTAPISCAKKHMGGFWYKRCQSANPNGLYVWGKDPTQVAIGINWQTWRGYDYSLKAITMKIRPLFMVPVV